MAVTVRNIVKLINTYAPPHLAANWDNPGLQVGRLDKQVDKVLLALDVTQDVLEEAKKKDIDLIITHHPLIFKPLKRISTENPKEKFIYELIKNDIAVISAHTNLDICENGVNDVLADIIGLKNTKVLEKVQEERLFKLVVFVPKSHSSTVREAICDNGAGWIGNYSHCTYNIEGIGTFMPREGTNPFIGKTNELEKVEEVRIETIVRESDLNKVKEKMILAHPYEEVAYDIYPLNNKGKVYGFGKIGEIEKETDLLKFAEQVKEKLKCKNIKVFSKENVKVKRVALCSGSGADFIKKAYVMDADVYITGDVKSYEAQMALELGMAVIDANHYDTEKVILPVIKKYLEEEIGTNKINVLISENRLDDNAPFIIV
ncbi:Nif3-like dinuclear metal center hexameric protein [Thermohalobacter berrensis]|uniref:GTP cyclohydrolase 1 type 2 homolog n=1 Tax=Thermohalobacter berrensis TaxID=99594 RepID=A0A419TB90_9FIRM|nr:Nif3-like dinuclear metal center hexameric protein [Thermohalobacter berrensis]RKD34717.1 Nif3-like dinuclear metal center hexameric protein [Thermohalobacter berrensis]